MFLEDLYIETGGHALGHISYESGAGQVNAGVGRHVSD